MKRHPLDSGLVAWERLTRRLAARYGVEDRVYYLADLDIAQVVGRSLGVVTVNSTVGTLALNKGKPVLVLGHAVYKVPGVVYKGTLDEFWLDPGAPDQTLYAAFRRVLIDQGLDMLVNNAVERLCGRSTTAERRADAPVRQINLARVS